MNHRIWMSNSLSVKFILYFMMWYLEIIIYLFIYLCGCLFWTFFGLYLLLVIFASVNLFMICFYAWVLDLWIEIKLMTIIMIVLLQYLQRDLLAIIFFWSIATAYMSLCGIQFRRILRFLLENDYVNLIRLMLHGLGYGYLSKHQTFISLNFKILGYVSKSRIWVWGDRKSVV